MKKNVIGIAYNSFFTKDDNEDALFELEKEQGTNLQIYDSIRTEEGKTANSARTVRLF